MGSDADEALFSEQSQELRKIGDNYRQEGEYKKALTAYERGLSLTSEAGEKASLYSLRALTYAKRGEGVDVIREAGHALKTPAVQEEDKSRALVARASAHLILGEESKAKEDLQALEGSSMGLPKDCRKEHYALKAAINQREKEGRNKEAPAGLGGMGLDSGKRKQQRNHQQQHEQQQQQQQQRQRTRSEVINLKAELDGDVRNIMMVRGVSLSEVLDAIRRRFPDEPKALRMLGPDGSVIARDENLHSAQDAAIQNRQQGAFSPGDLQMPAPLRVKLERVRPGAEGADRDATELEDWVLEFAAVFREHAGIDAETHLDLNAEGTGKTNNALDSRVQPKEAKGMLDEASDKFNESAASALCHWGNCLLAKARKRLDAARPSESTSQPPVSLSKQVASEADSFLSEADGRFNEALKTRPKFVDAKIGRVQLMHERARLLSADTGEDKEERFKDAEKAYADTEKAFEGLIGEVPDQPRNAHAQEGDDDASMLAQVRVLWGNALFEHSQFRARQGSGWKSLLDKALAQFKKAGCRESDIESALAGHIGKQAEKGETSSK